MSKRFLFEMDGVTATLAEHCRRLCANVTTAHHYLRKMGMDHVDAVRIAASKRRKQNIAELCREHGVSDQMVYRRLHSGWTLDQALTVPSGVPHPDRITGGGRYAGLSERVTKMRELRTTGLSYARIGQQFGISGQRAYQLISRNVAT